LAATQDATQDANRHRLSAPPCQPFDCPAIRLGRTAAAGVPKDCWPHRKRFFPYQSRRIKILVKGPGLIGRAAAKAERHYLDYADLGILGKGQNVSRPDRVMGPVDGSPVESHPALGAKPGRQGATLAEPGLPQPFINPQRIVHACLSVSSLWPSLRCGHLLAVSLIRCPLLGQLDIPH